LDDKEVVWIGSLTTTKASDLHELEELIADKYYKFMNLFGEPVAHGLPPSSNL
jgi:hypothetical protein